MAKLKDTLVYLLQHSTNKSDNSNARITKMVYLADWHQAVYYERQITNIDWVFNNFGPYVDDVRNEIQKHPDVFSFKETVNFYGSEKRIFNIINDIDYELSNNERKSLDFILKNTSHLSWDQFIKLVYSTHPILSSTRFSHLDLVEKAKEYKSNRLK